MLSSPSTRHAVELSIWLGWVSSSPTAALCVAFRFGRRSFGCCAGTIETQEFGADCKVESQVRGSIGSAAQDWEGDRERAVYRRQRLLVSQCSDVPGLTLVAVVSAEPSRIRFEKVPRR